MKKLILSALLATSSLYAGKISIAVAANVSYAIEDLKKQFNKTHPDTKIKVTLGSSGKLTAQIKNGAPYELFMSANMKYPNTLYKDGLAITKPLVYAKGSLALFSKRAQDFSKGLDLLKEKKNKRIAIANPKTAPYGIAAFEALKNANILDDIQKKFVYGESISQTLSYTLTAANIGIIAKSTLYSKKLQRFKENTNYIDIPSSLYTPINQGIVILKRAKQNKEVKAFYDFMQSNKAKKILKNYGYQVP